MTTIHDIDLLSANTEVPRFNGACRGMPTDWWFPEKSANGEDKSNNRKAVQICESCSSKNECLDFSLTFMNVTPNPENKKLIEFNQTDEFYV